MPAAAIAAPALWTTFSGAFQAFLQWPLAPLTTAALAPGALLAWLVGRHAPVVLVFEHELTHALTGLPFGMIPYSIIATAQGGYVKQITLLPFPLILVAILGGTISALAPYSLPLLAMTAAAFISTGKALTVGLLLGYHLWCKPKEIRENSNIGGDSTEGHTDISGTGYLISAAMIPVMALASYGWLLDVLVQGLTAGSREWLNTFLPGATATWQSVTTWVYGTLQELVH